MEAVNSTNPVLNDLENQLALMQGYIKSGDLADLEKVMANIQADYGVLQNTDPAALAKMVGLTSTMRDIFSSAWNQHMNGDDSGLIALMQQLNEPGSPAWTQFVGAVAQFDNQVNSGIIT
ncbi:MAG: hypothetical protein K1X28_03675 [Parachlamydiales bacterium]|nr:hypothetical protein [Parachlamydiales bacterium]